MPWPRRGSTRTRLRYSDISASIDGRPPCRNALQRRLACDDQHLSRTIGCRSRCTPSTLARTVSVPNARWSPSAASAWGSRRSLPKRSDPLTPVATFPPHLTARSQMTVPGSQTGSFLVRRLGTDLEAAKSTPGHPEEACREFARMRSRSAGAPRDDRDPGQPPVAHGACT